MLKTKPGGTQTAVGLAILGVWIVIAGAMIVKQARYDPDLYSVTGPQPIASEPGAAREGDLPDWHTYLPAVFKPLPPEERFDPTTLSDKTVQRQLPAADFALPATAADRQVDAWGAAILT